MHHMPIVRRQAPGPSAQNLQEGLRGRRRELQCPRIQHQHIFPDCTRTDYCAIPGRRFYLPPVPLLSQAIAIA